MSNKREEVLQMVAEEVKQVRDNYEPKLTQEKLGKKIGKTKQAISNIESAKYFPSVETLYDISTATKTNLIIEFKTDEQLKADEALSKLLKKRKNV
jgi:DNA-binding XRE family transcriptional regulator